MDGVSAVKWQSQECNWASHFQNLCYKLTCLSIFLDTLGRILMWPSKCGGHAVTQLCSAQGFQSTSVPMTFGIGSLHGCLCGPNAGVPAPGIPAELGWEVAWTLALRAPGWFPCAARVRTAISPHTFKLANSVSQRHVVGSCLVFPQSFLFCSWPLPSPLLLCGPASVLSASWDTSRGSSTVLYLISSSEQPSRVDVITPFYRRGD